MKARATLIALALAIAALLETRSAAAAPTSVELVVYFDGSRFENFDAGEPLIKEVGGEHLPTTKTDQGFAALVNFGPTQVIRNISIAWPNVSDASHPLQSLVAAIPYTHQGKLRLVLRPKPDVVDSVEEVERLYSTSPGNPLTTLPEDLLTFMEIAEQISRSRTNNYDPPSGATHTYELRSVYKYVEASIEVSKRFYIAPSPNAKRAAGWLTQAAVAVPEKFHSDLPSDAADLPGKLLAQQYLMLTEVWEDAKNDDCVARTPRLQALLEVIGGLGDRIQQNDAWRTLQIGPSHVQNALGQCDYQLAQRALRESTDRAARLGAARDRIVRRLEACQSALLTDPFKGEEYGLLHKMVDDLRSLLPYLSA